VLIGDGPERTALIAQCCALGFQDRVTFAGHRVDVRDLLPAFDVFVNCSVSEGISLTILEAMAAGLPVVATSVGGTPEIVVHESTGLLVAPRESPQLAAAVVRLISSGDERALYGDAGRQRVLSHFTITRMVDSYLEQYAQVAQGAA
jgi:glycosyltransferase involved in cell wall biosynthesis